MKKKEFARKMAKKAIAIGSFACILFLVFLVGTGRIAWDKQEGNNVRGDTTSEKLESLAGIITAKNKDFARVSFVGYNAKDNAWEFTALINHKFGDVFKPASPNSPASGLGLGGSAETLSSKYNTTLETLFVETSKILPDKNSSIRATVIFLDLVGVVESTAKPALIAAEPKDWRIYMKKFEQVSIISADKLREIFEKSMQDGREGQKEKQ